MEGIELDLRKEALQEIITLAMERKSGARALRSVMENSMLDLMFHLPEYSEDNVVKITIPKNLYFEVKSLSCAAAAVPLRLYLSLISPLY